MTVTRKGAAAVVVCAVFIVAIAFGTRQSFGLFMRPITLDLGWGREGLSLVFAIQALLNGLAAPAAGIIADKWGPGRLVAAGGLLYAIGLAVMAGSTTPTMMLIGGGVLSGMGISACGMPIMLSVIGKVAPEDKRSLWMGFVTAGGTAGQLAVIPLSQYVIGAHGWSAALMVLASATALIVPLGIYLATLNTREVSSAANSQTLGQALREARSHTGYVLLTLGFFVCGFQVQFIATHLPAFIIDSGLTSALAAGALVVIALSNMFGAALAGYMGGRWRKRNLLTGMYFARGVVIIVFISAPITETSVIIFSVVLGFMWLGTVPLTSGIVAQVFGPRYMATLFAIVYLSHQAGNFAGAWIGGHIFDATGSYDMVWWIAAILGFVATGLHAVIDDRPVARLSKAAAT